MFLSISVSINVWLLTVMVVRFFLVCLSPIAWSLLLPLFVASLCMTVVIHMYHWKCWWYIRHDPLRLRSFPVVRTGNTTVGVILLLWLEAVTFVLSSWLCCHELNPLVFLVIIPAACGTYTASTCSFELSESLELPSNVNALSSV